MVVVVVVVNGMLDADTVINNSSQKVGGSNAYPDPAPKKVGGSGPRKTHRIYAPGRVYLKLVSLRICDTVLTEL